MRTIFILLAIRLFMPSIIYTGPIAVDIYWCKGIYYAIYWFIEAFSLRTAIVLNNDGILVHCPQTDLNEIEYIYIKDFKDDFDNLCLNNLLCNRLQVIYTGGQ